jgi:thymidylate synthase (FAD)
MSTETTPRDLLTPDLLKPIRLLDHGFVRLVDAMPRLADGDETADHAIVRAARVSTAGGDTGTKGATSDRGLIRYLMRNWHTSPFEMVELKFHVKLPIFVARQWVRHRTASINEVSARYSVLPDEFYVPAPSAIREQGVTNRQGSGEVHDGAETIADDMACAMQAAFKQYRLDLKEGVSRETARVTLPVSTYTEWYWKANLLNVFRFLHLRMDHHAQHEIRVYADAMARLVRQIAPWSFEAFEDYWLRGTRLSLPEWWAILDELAPEQRARLRVRLEGSLSAGELRELDEKLRRR